MGSDDGRLHQVRVLGRWRWWEGALRRTVEGRCRRLWLAGRWMWTPWASSAGCGSTRLVEGQASVNSTWAASGRLAGDFCVALIEPAPFGVR